MKIKVKGPITIPINPTNLKPTYIVNSVSNGLIPILDDKIFGLINCLCKTIKPYKMDKPVPRKISPVKKLYKAHGKKTKMAPIYGKKSTIQTIKAIERACSTRKINKPTNTIQAVIKVNFNSAFKKPNSARCNPS